MDSREAIEQNFIPYPYTFPAIQFTVDSPLRAVDYPDRDPCPLGCGETRALCENQAERCTWRPENED